MKILHVMLDFPYPPDNGARADVWGRLLAMKRLGYQVDALVMAQKRKPEEHHMVETRKVVRNVKFVERLPLRKCLATIAPTSVSRNSKLSEIPLVEHYDLTIMEAEDTIAICDNPSLDTRMRVLRVHNDEIAYLREFGKAEERFLKRQFIRLEILRLIPFVKSVPRRVDSLWFISQSECERFIANYPSAASKALWLPPSISIAEEPPPRPQKSKRVLFIGNFYTPLNREGLRWYLNEVHPLFLGDADYELVIAGSTQGRKDARGFAEDLKQRNRCVVHVDLEDAAPLYKSCAVFINPMRAGAGVKLKSIHAIERGIPVVSTSVGNEGSGFSDKEHIRIANTPADFAMAVTELLENRQQGEEMAARAHEHLRAHYNCESNMERVVSCLTSRQSLCSADQKSALFA